MELTHRQIDILTAAVEEMISTTKDFGIKMADSEEELEENKALLLELEALTVKLTTCECCGQPFKEEG